MRKETRYFCLKNPEKLVGVSVMSSSYLEKCISSLDPQMKLAVGSCKQRFHMTEIVSYFFIYPWHVFSLQLTEIHSLRRCQYNPFSCSSAMCITILEFHVDEN